MLVEKTLSFVDLKQAKTQITLKAIFNYAILQTFNWHNFLEILLKQKRAVKSFVG